MSLHHELMRGVWLLEPDVARQYYPLVNKFLNGKFDLNIKSTHEKLNKLALFSASKPFLIDQPDFLFDSDSVEDDCIFILDIAGPITKNDQYCGPYGMKHQAEVLKLADAHPKVLAHVLRIDSGGGEGNAARFMATAVKDCSKPVYAFIDGFAASAAYWIASAANKVIVSSPMDRVGSIGTFVTIADYTEYYKNKGIRIFDVFAKKSKDKNRDYLDAIDGKTEKVQALVDQFNEFFLQSVIEYRGDALGKPEDWGTGKMFFAKEAMQLGLVDEIKSLDELLAEIFQQHSFLKPNQGVNTKAENIIHNQAPQPVISSSAAPPVHIASTAAKPAVVAKPQNPVIAAAKSIIPTLGEFIARFNPSLFLARFASEKGVDQAMNKIVAEQKRTWESNREFLQSCDWLSPEEIQQKAGKDFSPELGLFVREHFENRPICKYALQHGVKAAIDKINADDKRTWEINREFLQSCEWIPASEIIERLGATFTPRYQ